MFVLRLPGSCGGTNPEKLQGIGALLMPNPPPLLQCVRKTLRRKNFASRQDCPIHYSAGRQGSSRRHFAKKIYVFHEVIHILEARKPRFRSNRSGKDDKLGPSMIDRGTGSTDGTEGTQDGGRRGKHAPFAGACAEPSACRSLRPSEPSSRISSRCRLGRGQSMRSLHDPDRVLARGIRVRGKARSNSGNRFRG